MLQRAAAADAIMGTHRARAIRARRRQIHKRRAIAPHLENALIARRGQRREDIAGVRCHETVAARADSAHNARKTHRRRLRRATAGGAPTPSGARQRETPWRRRRL